MTEIRYIEGLYAFWDELRRRHPGSGSTTAPAAGGASTWRPCRARCRCGPATSWTSSACRSAWGCTSATSASTRAWRGGCRSSAAGSGTSRPTARAARRSAASPSACISTVEDYPPRRRAARRRLPGRRCATGQTLLDESFPLEQARAAIAERKSLRPFFLGDFYLLLPLTVALPRLVRLPVPPRGPGRRVRGLPPPAQEPVPRDGRRA